MNTAEIQELSEVVNYDEAPIVVLEVDGVEYRVDVGQGSAVAISQRRLGTWSWTLLTQARWDGSQLRTKCLTHAVKSALASALSAKMHDSNQGSGA